MAYHASPCRHKSQSKKIDADKSTQNSYPPHSRSGFSFLGDPSGAVENYTLSCRDHATVNGEDALATLNKIDGEDLYYGHITLYDDALTEKILNEDSQVEVSMTSGNDSLY